MDKFRRGIAPPDLIRQDYQILKNHERLRTTGQIQDLLWMQSIEGRSHNGAGVFSKRTYVNTSIDDIVRALGRDPDETKQARQSLIDDIQRYALGAMNGQSGEKLINANGDPFLGVDFLRDLRVNPRDVLRGIYMGGLRDNPEIRKKTEERYNTRIGCGELHLIDVPVMIEMGLDAESLAHQEHEADIEAYRRQGLILDRAGLETVDPERVRYYYIRHRLGPGESDDAAIVMAGFLYNLDVALGVFLADAIDTLEKYAPVPEDQDQALAYRIGRGFKDLRISMDDVYELTYLAAIPEAEESFVPDSSLRYLLSIDERAQKTALEMHLDFIRGHSVSAMPISFKRIMSLHFYEYIKRRLVNVRRLDALAVPDVKEQKWDRPLNQVINKHFLVVSDKETLPEVVRKFKESKCQIVIVVNGGGKVLGTLSSTDLIYLSQNG